MVDPGYVCYAFKNTMKRLNKHNAITIIVHGPLRGMGGCWYYDDDDYQWNFYPYWETKEHVFKPVAGLRYKAGGGEIAAEFFTEVTTLLKGLFGEDPAKEAPLAGASGEWVLLKYAGERMFTAAVPASVFKPIVNKYIAKYCRQ